MVIVIFIITKIAFIAIVVAITNYSLQAQMYFVQSACCALGKKLRLEGMTVSCVNVSFTYKFMEYLTFFLRESG